MKVKKQFVVEIREYVHTYMRAKVASHIVYMLLPLQAAVVLPPNGTKYVVGISFSSETHTPLPVFRRTVDPFVRPCTYFVLSYVMLCFFLLFLISFVLFIYDIM